GLDVIRALQHARKIRADQDVIFPGGLAPQERIERQCRFHVGGGKPQISCDVLHRLRRHIALLLLGQQQHGDQGRSLLRVDRHEVLESGFGLSRKHQRSHSSAPFFQTYTYPARTTAINSNISKKPKSFRSRYTTAQGKRNTASISKRRNSMATR